MTGVIILPTKWAKCRNEVVKGSPAEKLWSKWLGKLIDKKMERLTIQEQKKNSSKKRFKVCLHSYKLLKMINDADKCIPESLKPIFKAVILRHFQIVSLRRGRTCFPDSPVVASICSAAPPSRGCVVSSCTAGFFGPTMMTSLTTKERHHVKESWQNSMLQIKKQNKTLIQSLGVPLS